MLGDLINETTGKRIVRRVLSSDPLTVEVSFEDSGTMLGTPVNGFGTYSSRVRADGTIYGEGEGAMATADGELVSWKRLGPGEIRARRCGQLSGHPVLSDGIPETGALEQRGRRL
jgi:hypothetical protein